MSAQERPQKTHAAVVTTAADLPLSVIQVPTPTPVDDEIKVMVQWTASTPLDMHQALGHLLVKPPHILGDGVAGTVVEVGPRVTKYKPGDVVFGFVWRNAKEKAFQEFCVAPEMLFGLIPGIPAIIAGESIDEEEKREKMDQKMREAVTLPNNFVTAWHVLTADFGRTLEWPRSPDGGVKNEWFLIWGGGSSVAMYVLQVLQWYGYSNVAVVASKKHESKLKRFGASVVFDYREGNVVDQINAFQDLEGEPRRFEFILDCIGSLSGSVQPISGFARKGAKVAILLPVIVRDAAKDVTPTYAMDVREGIAWADGVDAVGVRTHFYLNNKFLADRLQSEIMPELLERGIIEPNDQVVVEGDTLLERAQKAIYMLRDKEVSGARLVWRVVEDDVAKQVLAGLDVN